MEVMEMVFYSKLWTVQEYLPDAKLSGNYDLLNDFHINNLTMENILQGWNKHGVDTSAYDPQDNICSKIVDNIE